MTDQESEIELMQLWLSQQHAQKIKTRYFGVKGTGFMEKALEKRTFITGATGDVGARKVASRRFAIALQYAAGAVLGLLLDVAFILFVLLGTTPSRRAIEPNKPVKLDQTDFSYPSHVVLQQAARSNGELLRNAEVLTRCDAMRSGLSANRFGFPLHQVDRTVEAIFHSYAQATVPTCDDDMPEQLARQRK